MNKLIDIIKNFNKLKILIVGDLMLDEYISGEVNRVSPEAPVPILDVKQIDYFPGGAANTARNAKSLSTQVILSGVIGPEEKGKVFRKILEKSGISSTNIIVDNERRTTTKTRIVARNQQIVRVDSEDKKSISLEVTKKLINSFEKQINEFNAIIISDYAKGVITPELSKHIIELAKKNKVLCVVDPKGNNYLKYKGCDIVTPNQKELAQALDLQIENEGQFLQAGQMLLSHVMCDNVLVTRGEKGMALFEGNGNITHIPAVNKNARDISGAGDTAIAVLTLSLAAGANLKQAMAIASYACGIVVGKVGTAVASLEELKQSLETVEL